MTMSPTHRAFNHVVAFEVAKDTLAVHVLPAEGQHTVPNKPKAIRKLLLRETRRNGEAGLGPLLVVCEATGGYERHVLEICIELDLLVHKAHGSRVRHFAKYLGLMAKTNRSMRACSPFMVATPQACVCTSRTPKRLPSSGS